LTTGPRAAFALACGCALWRGRDDNGGRGYGRGGGGRSKVTTVWVGWVSKELKMDNRTLWKMGRAAKLSKRSIQEGASLLTVLIPQRRRAPGTLPHARCLPWKDEAACIPIHNANRGARVHRSNRRVRRVVRPPRYVRRIARLPRSRGLERRTCKANVS
jgi:hypothetical protein